MPLSEAHKAKISAALKGKPKRTSAANFMDTEHKRKISVAQEKRWARRKAEAAAAAAAAEEAQAKDGKAPASDASEGEEGGVGGEAET